MEKSTVLDKNGIKVVNVLLCIIYLAPLLLLINPTLTKVSSMIIITLSLLIWNNERFYYILPIFIFFNYDLLLPGDILTYRVYSLLLFTKILFSNRMKIEKAIFLPFSIIVLYCISVMAYYDLLLSALVIFDLFLIILYISIFLRKNIPAFFTYYTFGAVISCVYGWFMQGLNIKTFININNQWVEVTRFIGSFPDPNYFGFFLNIGIFSVVILGLIKNKIIKISVLIFLYLSLISTLSITGYLCNILMLSLYLILSKKMKVRYIVTVITLGFIFFVNINFFENAEFSVISDMAKRINSQLSIGSSNNLSSFTTGRSSIWREHLEYFSQQPILNILFGGNFVTDFGRESKFNYVSHQAYIDMLLNFGIVGFSFLIIFLIFITLKYLRIYFETNNNDYLLLVVIKFIWVFYAFGLSMFPSWTFNLFFFI
ncbi:O-antigen ligase family protein [Solibacillus sp. FSL K6-1554]|uniref:O-antigen ligase family protein n=1 Tax=Solibacillus sp. FSL K6-1554 TaxID=2921472 RepID=UPI0030F66B00